MSSLTLQAYHLTLEDIEMLSAGVLWTSRQAPSERKVVIKLVRSQDRPIVTRTSRHRRACIAGRGSIRPGDLAQVSDGLG